MMGFLSKTGRTSWMAATAKRRTGESRSFSSQRRVWRAWLSWVVVPVMILEGVASRRVRLGELISEVVISIPHSSA